LRKDGSPRWHTVYSIISTIVEGAAIIAAVLWVLPLLGISIPFWGLLSILAVFGVFSYFMYLLGHPTISLKEMNAPESIVGSEGVVESDLDPEGYVKVAGELWKAKSTGASLIKGTSVIVTGINGLTLTAVRKQLPPQ
jgi:membrane-bound serine protease (ClpP class)